MAAAFDQVQHDLGPGCRRLEHPPDDLRPVRGYGFRYKDPSAPGADAGPQVGGMAQDIERSDAAAAVKNTPRGKMVDTGRLAMTMAPAVGQEQRRGDEQDARIGRLENALTEALRATRGGTFGDEKMELEFDREAGIWRAVGAVPGETSEERLERELRDTLNKRKADPFRGVRSPPIDYAGLDAAYRRELAGGGR